MGEIITGYGEQVGLCYWDGSEWQKLALEKIAGFESIVEESLDDTDLSLGTNTLSGTAVATGKVWKITAVAIQYIGTVPTRIYCEAFGLGGNVPLLDQASPVSDQWYIWTGEVYLQGDDYMYAVVFGATAGDNFYLRYAGIQMDAP